MFIATVIKGNAGSEKDQFFLGHKDQGSGRGILTSAPKSSSQSHTLSGVDLEGVTWLGLSGPVGSRLPAESRRRGRAEWTPQKERD